LKFHLKRRKENPFQTLLSLDNQFQCKIDIAKDMGSPQPLYLRPSTTDFFHPTDRSGILTMKANEKIELFCTNGFARPQGIRSNLMSISCANGNKLRMNGVLYNLSDFTCRKYPFHSVQRRGRCFNESSLVDVGFKVDEVRFVGVMSVCFNPLTERTYYTKYQLTPANVAAQQGFKRPKFIQGEFFPGKDINFLYTRHQQRETVSEIVKSEAWAYELVGESGDVFLSRGRFNLKNLIEF
jgi:hypothetical protein